MPQNPRLRRLEADYNTILDLKSRTDLVSFEIGENWPPDKYRVIFKCKGIMLNPTTGQPCITVNHAAEIFLHSKYPAQQPQMKWLTPIFHPNINGRNGSVCIQYWAPSMTLADLVIMLGDMVRYENFNPHSPLDTEAAKWADKNKDSFPMDPRPLLIPEVKISLERDERRASTEAEAEIEITLSPPTREAPVQEEPAPRAEAVDVGRTCTECGFLNRPGAVFCSRCGKPLKDVPAD